MSENKTIPYVSVVMPVFNAENYIFDVIDKIRKQTLKELEIIIVDDGSTDDTKNILERIAAEDNRVILLSCESNGGAGEARNVGLDYSQGEYIIFFDDDDFVDENLLEKAYLKAKAHDADVVVFRSQYYNLQTQSRMSTPWTIRSDLLPKKDVFPSTDIKLDFFSAFVWWPWDKMLKRDKIVAEGIKFQPIRTSNDLYFICAFVLLSERICILDEILIDHTVFRKTSLSNTREKSYHCAIDALEALRGLMVEREIFDARRIDFINYSTVFLEWHLNTLYGAAYFTLYDDIREYLTGIGAKYEDFYEDRAKLFFDHLYRLSADDYLFYLSHRLQNENDELSSANHDAALAYQALSLNYQDVCENLKKQEAATTANCHEREATGVHLNELQARLRAHENVILNKGQQLRAAQEQIEELTHKLRQSERFNGDITASLAWRIMSWLGLTKKY
ncbi:glycosyltransferase family 2 protein [Serratia fonticola]|uniref:glycosyltransferase family 2 protein n=1 Tax=Serratia fonticola TaxID=47917 RepID=UPI00217B8586|nr:glycosyltransferase family 2 protein [Serratia fonticola]CAI1662518.1 Hyaluronan synthase [Serratia fonticola]